VKILKSLCFIFLMLLVFTGYADKKSSKKRLSEDPFYQTGRFIMTKEEKKIYKHLPDQKARQEFIEEFWKIRDPNPATVENEYKDEYEARIEFANKWFAEIPKDNKRGWDTDRGRIYLVLGEPDIVMFWDGSNRWQGDHNRKYRHWYTEEWYYERHRLYLVFHRDGLRRYRLRNWPTSLVTALDSEKFVFDTKNKLTLNSKILFKAKYQVDHIIITIPIGRVNFEETEGKMKAKIHIEISVYLDHQRIDKIEKTETLMEGKEELLKKEHFLFRIPYRPRDRGKYLLEIVIEDQMSGSKYRNYLKIKV